MSHYITSDVKVKLRSSVFNYILNHIKKVYYEVDYEKS